MTDGSANTDAPPASAPAQERLFDAPPAAEQERMAEAILFAAAEPMRLQDLAARLPEGSDPARAIEALRRRYEGRGIVLEGAGGGFAFRTARDLAFLMRRETLRTRKLSRAAIETLAIVAYHQPTSRAEIEEIRGVSVSTGTLEQLLELDWIGLGKRRETPGRPVTYVTTRAFLDHFGLGSPRDLPGLKELRQAGLLENRPPPGTPLPEDDQRPLPIGGDERDASEEDR
ncbi:condensin subunit ScpB [Hasllibacter halocynthiae]|uniref:Condensin subunit ScpB n=1 Tax=Hasllibacter halocynthiae TaxID=595589 RepID=A0A2T0X7I0_9RHOB|nr:SMC-Scp complex subunit ScpB [Hasllibacter halocynthiae]PRY94889.1 condensin subunit ScpB [Hasllibacter halocynthiae]